MYRTPLLLALGLVSVSVSAHAADLIQVRNVALVPSSEPLEYNITLRSSAQFMFPLVASAMHLDSKQKTKSFTDLLKSKTPGHGAYLTNQIAERLRSSGYQVVILSDIARPADDPDSIEYEKLSFENDIALQVRIEAIGFYSGFGSASYVPKVNVGALSFTRRGAKYPYEASVYYGVDAKPDKDWAILSPDSFNFPTFEALTADPSAVDEIYREALSKIADRVVTQFRASSPLAPAAQ